MYKEYPTTWSFWHWTEDFQTQIGNYATAKESYLKAIDIMGAPYETDPIDSLAQVCEMDCDIQGAIRTGSS